MFTHVAGAPAILVDDVTLSEQYPASAGNDLRAKNEFRALVSRRTCASKSRGGGRHLAPLRRPSSRTQLTGLAAVLTMAKVAAVEDARQELGETYPGILIDAAKGHNGPAIDNVLAILRPRFEANFAALRAAVLTACAEDVVLTEASYSTPPDFKAARYALELLMAWDHQVYRAKVAGMQGSPEQSNHAEKPENILAAILQRIAELERAANAPAARSTRAEVYQAAGLPKPHSHGRGRRRNGYDLFELPASASPVSRWVTW